MRRGAVHCFEVLHSRRELWILATGTGGSWAGLALAAAAASGGPAVRPWGRIGAERPSEERRQFERPAVHRSLILERLHDIVEILTYEVATGVRLVSQ